MAAGLNIAFFGSSLVSAYWNGAATYYRGLIRALDKRGHRVTFYEPDAYERQQHRDIEDPDWAQVIVYSVEESEVFRCLDEAKHADVIVKASGVGVFDALLEAEIVRMGSEQVQTVFWDVDAPATLDRISHDARDPFREQITEFDLILTYGGGDPVVDAYRAWGAQQCVPIYNALDPETHHPVAPEPHFVADLAFLGNRLPDREARVDEFFFRAAGAAPASTFLLGGSGWSDKSVPSNVSYLGHIYTQQHNAFNCTARMVLNISRESMARYGFSPATRVFEAAGAGACVVTDYWEGIELFLEPDREVLVASDGEDVAEYLRSIGAHTCRAIGRAVRRRVLAEHTYDHRAVQVEQLLTAVGKPMASVGR
jgi:spore maturation protein CgeB